MALPDDVMPDGGNHLGCVIFSFCITLKKCLSTRSNVGDETSF